MHVSDTTPTERAARATWLLLRGWEPTTTEAARHLGIAYPNAVRLMERLSLVLPLYREQGYNGRWRLNRSELCVWIRDAKSVSRR